MKHHKQLAQKTLQIIINLKTSSNIQKRAWILTNFLKIFNRLASIVLIFFLKDQSQVYIGIEKMIKIIMQRKMIRVELMWKNTKNDFKRIMQMYMYNRKYLIN